MKKEIILNSTAKETRIAITEDGRLAELFVETPEKERMVGDIYFGRVARVLPGIRAAFIDIGQKHDAFLHFSNIGDSLSQYSNLFEDEDADVEIETDNGDQITEPEKRSSSNRSKSSAPTIERKSEHAKVSESQLVAGKEVLVQVIKEPVANKGVRVSTEISLPGRYLVLIPFSNNIGVSRKLNNYKEKRRLRKTVRSIIKPGYGAIIRTVAEGKGEDDIRKDLEELISTWEDIEKGVKNEIPPALLYKDIGTVSSVVRDLFTRDVARVVVDSKKLYWEIRNYVKWFAPGLVDKIEFYKGKEPIFDVFGVEKEIVKSLQRKVWLKSGGYIIIEPTEAMVVIDVNSGRFAANKEQEQNSLKTNLEAAREIARQLRLRDIGGMIVVDCIDLSDDRNQKKVFDEFRKELKKDRAKTTVYPMSELALIQITRQRIRQSILHSFTEPCTACGGAGLVPSKAAIVNRIERWLKRMVSSKKEYRLSLFINPVLADFLNEGFISRLTRLQLRYRVRLSLQSDTNLSIDEFKFISIKLNKDITELYSE